MQFLSITFATPYVVHAIPEAARFPEVLRTVESSRSHSLASLSHTVVSLLCYGPRCSCDV
jgi:hypothetical protein